MGWPRPALHPSGRGHPGYSGHQARPQSSASPPGARLGPPHAPAWRSSTGTGCMTWPHHLGDRRTVAGQDHRRRVDRTGRARSQGEAEPGGAGSATAPARECGRRSRLRVEVGAVPSRDSIIPSERKRRLVSRHIGGEESDRSLGEVAVGDGIGRTVGSTELGEGAHLEPRSRRPRRRRSRLREQFRGSECTAWDRSR
jgi:hypothetical protein